jgi:hypothetical protein
MVKWEHNIEYFKRTFDVLHTYLGSKVTGSTPLDSLLKQFSVQMIEKIHINLITCIDFLPMVEDRPIKFLSFGLVLRGMVSDLINYCYLRQVLTVAGKDVFENELKILDLDFVKAYRTFVDSEKKLGGADAEMQELMDNKFKESFKDFYNGVVLMKEKEFRTEEMMKPLRDFMDSKGIDKTANLSTEAGKLTFIVSKNIDQLRIVYKYLSQLQHFSSRAFMFYKEKAYQDFNPYFSLLVLFVVINAAVPIVRDLSPDEQAMENLVGLATEIAKLTE